MSSAGVPCYNRSKSRVVKRLPTFPIQTRPDQAQRRSSLGTAHNKLLSPDHSAQAATTAARHAGNWALSLLSEPTQILNRFPIQNRRDQARQQMSAGTARRGSKCPRAEPAKANRVAVRLDLRQIGYNPTSPKQPRFRIASRFKIAAIKRGSKRPRAPPAVLKIPARAFTRDRKRAIILEETRRGGNGIAAEGRKGDRAEPPRAA